MISTTGISQPCWYNNLSQALSPPSKNRKVSPKGQRIPLTCVGSHSRPDTAVMSGAKMTKFPCHDCEEIKTGTVLRDIHKVIL